LKYFFIPENLWPLTYAIYIDTSGIESKYIVETDLYYKLHVMPEWNKELMGWYHPSNTLDRCVGFFYKTENDGIAPFDYIDGDYLYRVSFDYGTFVKDKATDLELTHVPACSRLSITHVFIKAYKNVSCFLYTHPYLASIETTRVAHYYFNTDNSNDIGGQSISLKIPVVKKSSGVKFSYFFDSNSTNDGGYYMLNGFHWKADAR